MVYCWPHSQKSDTARPHLMRDAIRSSSAENTRDEVDRNLTTGS